MLVMVVLSLIVIGLFVAGVALLSQGFLGFPDVSRLVPREEAQKAEQALAAAKAEEEQLKTQIDKLALELQNAKADSAESQRHQQALTEARAALEAARQQVQALERDLEFLSGKADAQAKESVAMLERLDKEREELRRQLAEAAGSGAALEDLELLKSEKDKLQTQLDANIGRIRDLEGELKEMYDRSEGEQQQAAAVVRRLTSQNQKLQDDLKLIVGKIGEVRELAAEQLRGAQQELDASRARILGLDAELRQLREQLAANESRLAELQSRAVETVPPAAEPVPPGRAEAGEMDKLSQVNAHLLKKQELLERELTKQRARALGLEKICHEFKLQFNRDET